MVVFKKLYFWFFFILYLSIFAFQCFGKTYLLSADVLMQNGNYYKEILPKTLDLSDRARLTINALTAPTDPDANYELYWAVNFNCNPPVMSHDWNDWVQTKFIEALPLLRLACGDKSNAKTEEVLLKTVIDSVGPDGLFYINLEEEKRPWCRLNSHIAPGTEADLAGVNKVSKTDQNLVTACFHNGRLISALTIYYLLNDKNEYYETILKRAVDRLNELAIDKGDYVYFPSGVWGLDAVFEPNTPMPLGMMAEENGGRAIQGLVHFYNASSYEPAIKLAGKLVNYMLYHANYFGRDGQFIADPWRQKDFGGAHFHAHTICLLSILDYALAANDKELQKWCEKSFKWASQRGNSLVGFFPENLGAHAKTVETCEVADMIGIALKLSSAGIGDYWDDADRWIRNQFFENQLTEIDWIYELANKQKPRELAYNECGDKVPERNIGAFAGWATANEFGNAIMHCCTGNAARTVYYIWQSILNCDDSELYINLLMNRASKWADVMSYIPYQGCVEVKIKKSLDRVFIRAPQWIDKGSKTVRCYIDEKEIQTDWQDRYVIFKSIKKHQHLKVEFPILTHKIKTEIGLLPYALTIKGNTVTAIEPSGKTGALYERDYYNSDKAPVSEKECFVSGKTINW